MASVLTVTANTLVDWLADSELKRGAVNRVRHFEAVAGGKGLNMARVLARFGHRVIAAGFAGGPTGAMLRELVASDGIEPQFVETAARTRVGFEAVHASGATAVLEDGFEVRIEETDRLVEAIRARLGEVGLVIIGGSVPHPSCLELYARIAAECARARVPCWLDAYGEAAARAIGGTHPPALAAPNRQEFGDGRAFAGCAELHLKDGPRPVEVRLRDAAFRVTPPKVVEVNPIGSGDCYLAALAHARLVGLPIEEQLRFASAAGAANAARADVARIGPADVEPLLAAVRVEPLA